jgi:hypothetical protein
VCPFTFDDNTLQAETLCDFVGPTNADPLCPSDLEALLLGDGSNVAVSIGVIIDNTPDTVLFAATKVSPVAANLTSYQYGQGTALLPVSGTIQLTQGGRVLGITISPDTPLGSDQCSFSQYDGTFIRVVGGSAGG